MPRTQIFSIESNHEEMMGEVLDFSVVEDVLFKHFMGEENTPVSFRVREVCKNHKEICTECGRD